MSLQKIKYASMVGLLVTVLVGAVSPVQGAVPSLPQLKRVADSGKPAFGSAHTPGVNFYDLAKAGYVEEEYYLSGLATARDENGAVIASDEPYTTRFIIRKPKSLKKFSGTVIVTPFNWDRDSQREWGFTKQYLTQRGDVFIGLSLDKVEIVGFPLVHGIKMLQAYDPSRYGALAVYDDKNPKRQEMSQTQDILAQLANLLKANNGALLGGIKAKRVIGYSLGVGGPVFERYMAQGRHNELRTLSGKALYDAYMIGANNNLPVPDAMTRADAVMVVIQNEREFNRDNVANMAIPEDSDTPKFRLYDFIGSPHLGVVVVNDATGEYALGNDTPELPKAGAPRAATGANCSEHNNAPVGFVQSALLDGVVQWLSKGKPMPRAPRVELAGAGLGEKLDADTGNAAAGGLRPPWITAPAATYYTGAAQNCGVWEPMKMYDAAQLNKRYGSYENYVKVFNAAKALSVNQRYLLAEQARDMKPVATKENFRVN